MIQIKINSIFKYYRKYLLGDLVASSETIQQKDKIYIVFIIVGALPPITVHRRGMQ